MRNIKLKYTIAVTILLLFVIFNYLNFNYLHFHLLGDGKLVIHTHPYEKNTTGNIPIKSHKHTNFEFLLFNLITNIEFFVILLLVIILFKKLNINFSSIVKSVKLIRSLYATAVLRAPPFL